MPSQRIKAGRNYRGPRNVVVPDPRHPSLFDSDAAALVRKLRIKHTEPCPVCDEPSPFTWDEEFEDETGFVCKSCGSNIYYDGSNR